VTIDLDATLVESHSEKERAAGTYKRGFGFHPLLAYFDESHEAAAGQLRSGNAGANSAADQIEVAERALGQIPTEQIETIEVLLRVDSAGATHDLLDWAREGRIGFSVGYDIAEPVRAAILALTERSWRPALDQDGSERDNGEVAEITQSARALRLARGLAGDRAPRASAPRRAAVLYRPPGPPLPGDPHRSARRRHRAARAPPSRPREGRGPPARGSRTARARVEDQIRADKDTGLSNLPFRDFDLNAVWLELVLIAHDLIAWTRALSGELQSGEPKRLRLPPAAHRRPACLLGPPGKAATRGQLALGRRPGRRLRQAQSAPSARRLTPPRATAMITRGWRQTPRKACPPPRRSPLCEGANCCQLPRRTQDTPLTNTHQQKLTAGDLLQDPG